MASSATKTHCATHPLSGGPATCFVRTESSRTRIRSNSRRSWRDNQSKFAALVGPIYDACCYVADSYRGAFAHGDHADWPLLDVESMSEHRRLALTSR